LKEHLLASKAELNDGYPSMSERVIR
jgi:hypothetical protein